MDSPIVLTSMNDPLARQYLVGHNRPRAHTLSHQALNNATRLNPGTLAGEDAVETRRCTGGWVAEINEARPRTGDAAGATR